MAAYDRYSLFEISRIKAVVCFSMILAGLAAIFVSGVVFNLFGNDVDFANPGTYIFCGGIAVAMYGCVYMAGPAWWAVKAWFALAIILTLLGLARFGIASWLG
jgi:hypothetical protein